MSAKPKGVGQCIFDIHLNRSVSYIVQIALFVRYLIACCLMDQPLLEFFDSGDHFYCTCCAQKMSCNGLGGVYFHFFCMLTKCLLDRDGLE